MSALTDAATALLEAVGCERRCRRDPDHRNRHRIGPPFLYLSVARADCPACALRSAVKAELEGKR